MREQLLDQIVKSAVRGQNISEMLKDYAIDEIIQMFRFEDFEEMRQFFRWKGYDVSEYQSQGGKIIVTKAELEQEQEDSYRMKTNYRVIESKRVVDGKYLIRREAVLMEQEITQLEINDFNDDFCNQQSSVGQNFQQQQQQLISATNATPSKQHRLTIIPGQSLINNENLRNKDQVINISDRDQNSQSYRQLKQNFTQKQTSQKQKTEDEKQSQSSISFQIGKLNRDPSSINIFNSMGNFAQQNDNQNDENQNNSNAFKQQTQQLTQQQSSQQQPQEEQKHNQNSAELDQSSSQSGSESLQQEKQEQSQLSSIITPPSQSCQLSLKQSISTQTDIILPQQMTMQYAIKLRIFKKWKDQRFSLNNLCRQFMQEKEVCENIAQANLLSDPTQLQKLAINQQIKFYSIAILFAGMKKSQQNICDILIQDLTQFELFELIYHQIEYFADHPQPKQKLKIQGKPQNYVEHQIYRYKYNYIVITKFAFLNQRLVLELIKYDSIIMMGFKNNKTLQFLSQLTYQAAGLKQNISSDKSKIRSMFTMINCEKNLSNDELKEMLMKYTDNKLIGNFYELKNTLRMETDDDSRLRGGYWKQIERDMQLSRQMDQMIKKFYRVVAEDMMDRYNMWLCVIRSILHYLKQIFDHGIEELNDIPDIIYTAQSEYFKQLIQLLTIGFTQKQNSIKQLHRLIQVIDKMEIQSFTNKNPIKLFELQAMLNHALKCINSLSDSQQELILDDFIKILHQIGIQKSENDSKFIPLGIPFFIFNNLIPQSLDITIPFNKEQSTSLKKIIQSSQFDFQYYLDMKPKRKRNIQKKIKQLSPLERVQAYCNEKQIAQNRILNIVQEHKNDHMKQVQKQKKIGKDISELTPNFIQHDQSELDLIKQKSDLRKKKVTDFFAGENDKDKFKERASTSDDDSDKFNWKAADFLSNLIETIIEQSSSSENGVE